jgi:hypothetical protein
MGLFTSTDGEVRVVAAPFCTLTLVPTVVEVRKGDLDMVARFAVNIAWDPLYTKPVYLLVAGFSEGTFSRTGVSLMVPDGAGGFKDYALVPNGVPDVDLEMDMTGMDVIAIPFSVGGYEDEPIEPVV